MATPLLVLIILAIVIIASIITSVVTYVILSGRNKRIRLAEKNNLFFLAVNLKDQKLITNVQHTMDLQQNLDAFMLNRTEKNDRTLKKTDEYELTETRGKEAGTEYLMMRGTLGSNYIFLIQSPIESIQQSVALSNKFLIVVELIVLVVGIWMVWFFSKRLTEPLRELAGLSEKI